MGMIITATAVLIALWLILRTKTASGELGFSSKNFDPIMKSISGFISALQGN